MADVPTGIWIRVFKKTWEYCMNWFKLPLRVKEMNEKLTDKPISTEAKFCPECDKRMKVARRDGQEMIFYCKDCDVTMYYKIPKL